MFDRLTSFSILNPPATTKLVLYETHDQAPPGPTPFHPSGRGDFYQPIKANKGHTENRGKQRRRMSSQSRSSSPGGRRIVNPGRLSDASYYSSINLYPSPRGSAERVVPISSTTYVNAPRSTSDRLPLDTYTSASRPRRSTLTESGRPATSSSSSAQQQQHTHSRSRPAIVQSHGHADRASSPSGRPGRSHDPAHNQEYYVTPASTSAPRREHAHKKVYSIDDGKSHLVADIDMKPSRSTRRSSVDRNGYRSATAAHSTSHRNSYHSTGPSQKRQDHVDIDSGFSYTDPAGMYRDTEPRRRPRAGSVEGQRNRPSSMILDTLPPRASARDPGPPTSRALDRYNDSLGFGMHRSGSLRDSMHSTAHPPYQDIPSAYSTSSAKRHSAAIHQDRSAERRDTYPLPREAAPRDPLDERRDTRDPDRSHHSSRAYEDQSVERRGFGIRNHSPGKRGPARGSDESLASREAYLDRGVTLPQTHAPVSLVNRGSGSDAREAPHSRNPRDDSRRDEERRDYEYARDLERQERERLRYRDPRDQERREKERGDPRDQERREKERVPDDQAYPSERERDRERLRPPRDPASVHEPDRDRRDRDKWNAPPKDVTAAAAAAAAATVALPAAVGGLSALAASRSRDFQRERGRQSPVDGARNDERSKRHRDSRDDRVNDEASLSDRERRAHASNMDQRSRDSDRARDPPDTHSPAYLDPDEEYRRRVQQAQREIANVGNADVHRDSGALDASPDPEHRRRERTERGSGHPYNDGHEEESPPPRAIRRSPDESRPSTTIAHNAREESAPRDSRVRIVDPPNSRDEQQQVKGILRRPTEKFPEDPHPIREGVAPLKDTSKDKSIPTDARWTKISRELVNPDCLKEAKERFEEREDCVIVLRVLTKEEIQKLADRTAELRYSRYEDADRVRRERRRKDKEYDQRERDEYSDHSEDEYAHRPPRMLEGTASSQEVPSEYNRDRRRD